MSLRSLITNRASDNLDELKKNLNPLHYGGYVNRNIVAPAAQIQSNIQTRVPAWIRGDIDLLDEVDKLSNEIGHMRDTPIIAPKNKVAATILGTLPATSWATNLSPKQAANLSLYPVRTGAMAAEGGKSMVQGSTQIGAGLYGAGKSLTGKQTEAERKQALRDLGEGVLKTGTGGLQIAGSAFRMTPFGATTSIAENIIFETAKNIKEGKPATKYDFRGVAKDYFLSDALGIKETHPYASVALDVITNLLMGKVEDRIVDIGKLADAGKLAEAFDYAKTADNASAFRTKFKDYINETLNYMKANPELGAANFGAKVGGEDIIAQNKNFKSKIKPQDLKVKQSGKTWYHGTGEKQMSSINVKDTTEQIKASPELGGIRPKEYITKAGKNIPESKQMEVLSRMGAGKNEFEDILKAQEIKANKADSDLLSKAKKYKSADEFVKSMSTLNKEAPIIKDIRGYKISDLSDRIPPTNNDGTITLYHATTKDGADSILKSGFKGSRAEEGNVFFTTDQRGGQFIGADKNTIIETKIRPEKLLQDISDTNRHNIVFSAKDTDIIGVPTKIVENPKPTTIESQLTDIWNQANKAGGGVKIPEDLGTQKVGKTQYKQKPQQEIVSTKSLEFPYKDIIPLSQEPQMQYKDTTQSYEDIIAQNKKMIGSTIEKPTKSVKETFDTLYTQWVDRYEPITRASKVAKTELKAKGAQLRPEYDPEYLVRRLTGAGGIADARYQNELKPIIDTIDDLKIDKSDMDLYLANKRIAGFEAANRKVYGADTAKAKQIVNAIETKYGADIQDIANRLYEYQDKGFQEMVDAGFISPVTAKVIRGQNPDYAPLQRVMDEVDDYLGLPTRKTMQGTQPISKLKGSTRQIESPLENIIANTFKQRAAIEKNRVARSIVDLQKVAPQLGFSKTAKAGDDTITVWNNGKKEFWKVGEEIAETAKGLNEENVNTILKIFRAPASLLRQGATGRNPEFMVPNFIRDQFDAAVASKYGYIPFIDYLSGLKSMLTKDDIYRKWENSGAKIDLGEMSGRKSIQESFNSKTAKKNLFSWVTKGLDVMGELSEQPTRVGLFKKAYKKTGNEMLAMMESRDATVDFARMGSKMKVANSIIPFLNVQVQGFDKLIRAVKDHPAKVAFLGTVYGALPALATTIYNIINHPEEYSEIQQYEKDSNFVIVTGRNEDGTVNYITIPKGNIIPVIANPVENFLLYFAGTSPLEFKEFATQFITSTLPVIGEGTSLSEVALKTVGGNLPQLVKPITENLVNKSFYRYDPKKEEAREIVPFYLKDKEPYKQTYKFTPKMYQTIGAIFNVSPLKVKNLMEGYLAGYAKIPAQIIEMAYKAGNKEEISPNEKTILRRFFKQTYPTSAKASTVSERTTPFLQRITGKVSASEEARMELDEARDEARYSGKPVATKDSIVYPYNDTTRVVKRIITPPELTSNNELNKKIVSDYKSDLTDYGNYIMYLYKNKLISEEKAGAELEKVELYKDIISGTTKSGKKAKKVDLAAISQKILKPVKVEVNTPKLNTFDILSGYSKIKAPTIEVPNLEVGVPKFDLPELTLPNFRKEL